MVGEGERGGLQMEERDMLMKARETKKRQMGLEGEKADYGRSPFEKMVTGQAFSVYVARP